MLSMGVTGKSHSLTLTSTKKVDILDSEIMDRIKTFIEEKNALHKSYSKNNKCKFYI